MKKSPTQSNWLEDVTGMAVQAKSVPEDFHLHAENEGLFAYGIFNPFGPTVCAVSELRFRGCKPRVLYFRMLNPFEDQNWVIGLVKSDAPPGDAESLLVEMFAKEAIGEAQLVGSLPTWILAKGTEWLVVAERCFNANVRSHSRLPELRRNLGSL